MRLLLGGLYLWIFFWINIIIFDFGFIFRKLYPGLKENLEQFRKHLKEGSQEMAALKVWQLQGIYCELCIELLSLLYLCVKLLVIYCAIFCQLIFLGTCFSIVIFIIVCYVAVYY